MKIILFCIFAFLSFSLFAEFTLRVEPLTEKKIKTDHSLRYLNDSLDKGYCKHMIFVSERVTEEKELYFWVNRPLTEAFFEKTSAPFHMVSSKLRYPFFISSRGFFQGEKVLILFKTLDGSFEQVEEIIPYPLIASSNDLVLDAELLNLTPTIYGIRFQGLNEGEKIRIESTSCGEIIEQIKEYNPNEVFCICPGVDGQSGGKAKLCVSTRSGKSVSIHLPWGKRLFDDYLKRTYLQ